MAGKRINKKELAYAKVMTDLGHSPTSIAKSMGRSHHTIIKHLQQGCDDPEVDRMVGLIKQAELSELHTISWKSRAILNNYLDSVLNGEKEPNPISVTAIMDRSFQQRQLLENKPTEIINTRSVVEHCESIISEADRQLSQLTQILQERGVEPSEEDEIEGE